MRFVRSGRLAVAFVTIIGCASGDDDDDNDDVRYDAMSAPSDATVLPDAMDGAPGNVDASPGATDAMLATLVCDQAALIADNDTCAAVIDLTAGASMSGGTTTHGDTAGYVNDLQPPAVCTDAFGQDGPDAVYSLTASAGQTIAVTMTPEAFDGSLYILSMCDDASCELGADDAFEGEPETLSYPVATEGLYFVVVDSYVPDEQGCFTLHVELL